MEGLRHFQHSGLKNYPKIGKFRKIGIFLATVFGSSDSSFRKKYEYPKNRIEAS